MGDKPLNDGNEPSLELPSLFGRKKKAPAPEVKAEPPAEASKPEKTPKPAKAPKSAKEPKPAKEPQPAALSVVEEEREFKLPPLPGRVAAILTGILVGVLGTLLTWGSLETCEALQGTDSCGGEGFFLLIFILVLMILAGGLLLAAWDVADPRSTSALGVGIVCILVLLLLMEDLFEAWMFAVVPVISALAYAGAHWVTTALVDEVEPEESEAHDIR
ncbi:MAG TPA: hypothetical protein VLI04_01835 [Nocardioidaceae bacterium]|nr:hypothetical protein [Nocardioidaceae bacterium]